RRGPGAAPPERGRRRHARRAGRDQRGLGRHGRQLLHRQRAELDGEVDRGGGEDPDALVLRLHALQRRDPAPALRDRDGALLSLTAMVTTPVLVLPGYGDSGPGHWQSRWEAADGNLRRVLQRDWLMPDRAEWLAMLEHEIAACAAPPVLVAHSLGCALVAHRVTAGGRHRAAHGVLLLGLEGREDMIGHLRLVCGAADADLHAADGFSTERVDDRLHAVVAARAASQARADLAERHVDVVVDEHEVLGTRAERQQHVTHA